MESGVTNITGGMRDSCKHVVSYVSLIYRSGIDTKSNWRAGGHLTTIKSPTPDFMLYNEYEARFEIMKHYPERKYIRVF